MQIFKRIEVSKRYYVAYGKLRRNCIDFGLADKECVKPPTKMGTKFSCSSKRQLGSIDEDKVTEEHYVHF